MLASKAKQFARPLEHALLGGGAPAALERVARVVGEAAGEVAPIVGVVAALHRYLLAGVNLRRAAYGRDVSHVQHRAFRCRAFERHEAARVVIVLHRDEARRVWVERVGAKDVAQLPRGQLAREDLARDVPRRKGEDRREFRVYTIPARVSADEETRVDWVCVEDFADHPHARVLPAQRLVEVAYEEARHVLGCVLSYTGNARHADPPQRVLYFVARDLGRLL